MSVGVLRGEAREEKAAEDPGPRASVGGVGSPRDGAPKMAAAGPAPGL